MEISEYLINRIRETPTIIQNNIFSENDHIFPERRILLVIKEYMDNFISGKTDERFLIMPGLRGVGKTTAVLQSCNYLLKTKNIKNENILYISADEIQTVLDKTLLDVITNYVENIHQKSFTELNEKLFIFIDEAHFDKDWAESTKVIFDRTKNIFLLITGSSALSLETNTDIARRATKKPLFPLNFSEYMVMKHNFYPPKGTAEKIREVIFDPNEINIQQLNKIENSIMREGIRQNKSLDKELRYFTGYGGFAFGLNMKKFSISEKTFDIIDRVTRKDLPTIYPFTTQTQNTILRLMIFLALKRPGEISQPKLAQRLDAPPAQINQSLDALEKAHVIFSIKPYGGASKISRKPWKYYFLTPTLVTSIFNKMGKFDIMNNEVYGKLVENLIASYLFRMNATINMPAGIFYPDKGSSDFILISGVEQKPIPVEVSCSNKAPKQIENDIRLYKADYGIFICKCDKTELKDNVLYIPLEIFAFV